MTMTLATLPTADALKADHRAAMEFALGLDPVMTRDFLRDYLDGADLEARWLGWIREDLTAIAA